MRFSSWLITGALLVGISACDRPDSAEDRRAREEKTDQAAHKAGEEAYRAAQKTKELTREAVDKLRKAGHEVREGWEDAKHNDPEPVPPPPKR
jgi:DNA-directed RNA polymerase specialized sigma24 family protein